MEEAIKILLKSGLDTSITFNDFYTISFIFKRYKEDVTFCFHHTNEKLPRLIELFGQSKQKVDISISDQYGRNEKLVKLCLVKLNISNVSYYISPHNYLRFRKDQDRWILFVPEIIPREDARNFLHLPFLCLEISGYSVLAALEIGKNRQNHSIRFALQVSGREVILKEKVHIGANRVYFWLEDEKINIEHINFDIDRDLDDYLVPTVNNDDDPETKLSAESINIHDFNCMKLDFVIVNGLSGQCGPWSDFLTKGLYDPRLFLHIAAFFNENFCY